METIKRGYMPKDTVEFGLKAAAKLNAAAQEPAIKSIWFEFLDSQDSTNRFDSNSDVVFELNDGSRWGATFFTYQNIETLRKKNQQSGECLNGSYFCAEAMILVSEMSEEVIGAVLQEMLSSGEIEMYCHRLHETNC